MFEPNLSSVWVMKQARYGLRGERWAKRQTQVLFMRWRVWSRHKQIPMWHTDLELCIST